MKNVQIPYHLNSKEDSNEEIRQGLERKLDTMLNRQLYSQYKTPPQRNSENKVRQEYLDRRGVSESYRWTSSPWEL